jgi:multiple antibiotic resistance protein
MIEAFLLAFIPLFVAIDVVGVLPLFVGITHGMDERRRTVLTTQATVTAFAISVIFLVAGKVVFAFLGIVESDFRVGGGIVLLVLAVYDLLFSADAERKPDPEAGIVPIGIPLIMGPAALTTIIVLVNSYGYGWTLAALMVNLAIVWLVFTRASVLMVLIGTAGAHAMAKVVALFLAGIAVMMIRTGIEAMLRR